MTEQRVSDDQLAKLIAEAKTRFDALSPEEQAVEREAQRQSWLRGEMGMNELATMMKLDKDVTIKEQAAEIERLKARLSALTSADGLDVKAALAVHYGYMGDDLHQCMSAALAAGCAPLRAKYEAAMWVITEMRKHAVIPRYEQKLLDALAALKAQEPTR